MTSLAAPNTANEMSPNDKFSPLQPVFPHAPLAKRAYCAGGVHAFRLFIDLMFFDLGATFPFFDAPAGLAGENSAAFAEMLAYPAAWSYGFALLLFALCLTLGWMDARRNRDAAPGWRIKRQRRNVLDFQREP